MHGQEGAILLVGDQASQNFFHYLFIFFIAIVGKAVANQFFIFIFTFSWFALTKACFHIGDKKALGMVAASSGQLFGFEQEVKKYIGLGPDCLLEFIDALFLAGEYGGDVKAVKKGIYREKSKRSCCQLDVINKESAGQEEGKEAHKKPTESNFSNKLLHMSNRTINGIMGSMALKKQFMFFILRWVLNSLGLWVAVRLISSITYDGDMSVILLAGLILSVINVIIKPVLVILSLPFIVVTLGLFMLVVNGLMVYLAAALSPGLQMGFGSAILAGLIVGLINYALTHILDLKRDY